ncbi:hypothetical protein MMB17_06195 [Methylobacterium organophilum]|uniref:hypothetical protein n=1 Tax=Methylobacterium organophilum TaxID=410 RepID=UPI001F14978B|nr:hypothetical protein [Methylobacterium organophilum]UMY18893.1 hypothetical protein MMB17_06195 [Methylobacterium organophilum]
MRPNPTLAALVLGLFAASTVLPAQARSAREEISPAEEQTFPYDANIPGCQDPSVLETVSSQFAEKEEQYWNSSMTIVAYDHIERTAWRPYGVDFIPRRFCTAVATTSDGLRRKIDYSVRESTGLIGASWGIDFCVHGLDRNLSYAYATACRMARP